MKYGYLDLRVLINAQYDRLSQQQLCFSLAGLK